MNFDKKDIYDLITRIENSNINSLDLSIPIEKNGILNISIKKENNVVFSDNIIIEDKKDNSIIELKSLVQGTFYDSASPSDPPFIQVNQEIKKGQTLCIIESMKIMNKLNAEFDLKILSIEIESGDLVNADTILFKVEKL